jgi:hypothetical protein
VPSPSTPSLRATEIGDELRLRDPVLGEGDDVIPIRSIRNDPDHPVGQADEAANELATALVGGDGPDPHPPAGESLIVPVAEQRPIEARR